MNLWHIKVSGEGGELRDEVVNPDTILRTGTSLPGIGYPGYGVLVTEETRYPA